MSAIFFEDFSGGQNRYDIAPPFFWFPVFEEGKMKKRCFCWVVWGVALLTIHGAGHAAEKYPTRAIELVAPTRPGGSSDVVARLYNDVLSKNLKVSIIM